MKLTLDRLREVLFLDAETNRFYWFNDQVRGNHAGGKLAGTIDRKGYRRIQVDKRLYREHRLVWLWYYGKFPVGQLDHKDGNRLNNCIDNLREATPLINSQNRRVAQPNSKSGYLGVHWHKKNGVWVAKIGVNNQRKYLGCFDSPELAHAAYIKAKRELHIGNTL